MNRKKYPDSTPCPDCKPCPSCGLMAHDDKPSMHSGICMHEAKGINTVGFIVEVPEQPDVAIMLKRMSGELYIAGHVLPTYMRGKKVLVTVKLYEEGK